MIIIRPLVPADAAAFLELLHVLDAETKFLLFEPGERQTTVAEQRKIIEDINAGGGLIWAAEDSGHLVGFLSARRGGAKRMRHSVYIVVAILQAYTHQGIGTRLFTGLEQWARTNGLRRLELTTMAHNVNAIALYQKMGFEIEGTKRRSMCIDGNDIDEYYMGKLLD